jgi:HK97 gp10 family phage protein
MATKVRVEGLRELEAALKELPKATGKRVLRNSLRKAAEPIARDAAARAPVDDGTLRDSIGVGTRLTKRQAGLHRKMFRDDRASVEMFVGAGGLAQATQMEFGNFKDSPQPYMRPAWDGNKMQALETIKTELWNEIQKAAARHARKMARLAAKG